MKSKAVNQVAGVQQSTSGNIMKMLTAYVLLALLMITCRPEQANQFVDITSPAGEKKIDSLLALMTLEEKVNMLCGNGLFTSPGVERLGIGDLQYTDGPFGIREELGKKSWAPLGLTTDSATFFPTGSALAATWSEELAWQYGNAMGEEAKTRGKDILLGPAINITRTPINGRTYEYMSEDPLLNSRLAVGYVKGVQNAGVVSCIKHYAANNQETFRGSVDVRMDERTLREIYLPAFKAAVTEGGAYAVMAAYNKFRGDYCAENDYLLNQVLKTEWQFKGMVMSDWGGTHSTVKSALNGLEVEMGSARFFTQTMVDSVKNGLIPETVIDDKIRRILRAYYFSKRTPFPPVNSEVSTPAHNQTAYDVAAQSIVLLKNIKKTLPLNARNFKHIVVIGENAVQTHAQGGFGAGVKARYEVTPLEGLKNRLGSDINIEYVPGYKASYIMGKPFGKFPAYETDRKLLDEAVKAASEAEVTLLFVGNNREVETENADRKSLQLPFGQDELVKAVCKANPHTIVVVVAGAPVNMHVIDSCASTVLWSWFNGSQGGNALSDVILGKVNPSGKLPFTIPVKLSDSPAHALGTFPGKDSASYSEGILVGYRWYDTKQISPKYPFGYGLSYTDFAYNNLQTDKESYRHSDVISLSLTVKNTGNTDGYETVQLYASETASKVMKPVRELKAFKKVMVPVGEAVTVNLELPVSDLAWFNEQTMTWEVNSGKYQLAAGSSSGDIRKVVEVAVK